MSQISPPMRILLVVAVAFLVAWMLFLKPGGETETAATPAATPAGAVNDPNAAAGTKLGQSVESAQAAAKATEAASAASSGETASSAPGTSSSTTTAPAPATASADPALDKLPDWLQTSLDKKVVVILFTNGESADDRRTRAALADAYTAHGKVVTRAVNIKKISRYRGVAEGVDVRQSPTLMVIDRNRQANSLVGYSSLDTINQAIIDGLLATDNPIRTVPYLQEVQTQCRKIANQAIIGEGGGRSPQGFERDLSALIATMGSALAELRATKVPPAYRPLSRLVNRYIASYIAGNRQIKATAIGANSVNVIKARRVAASNDKLVARTQLELGAVGISACN